MKGIFTLTSPQDLLAKLRRDFSKLEADPANADLAFNFFVTANAMCPRTVYNIACVRFTPLVYECSRLLPGTPLRQRRNTR